MQLLEIMTNLRRLQDADLDIFLSSKIHHGKLTRSQKEDILKAIPEAITILKEARRFGGMKNLIELASEGAKVKQPNLF